MGAPHYRSVVFRCLSFALCLTAPGSPLLAQVLELPLPRIVQNLLPIPFEEWPDPSMAGHTFFGTSVSVSGNTALIGIPGYRDGIGRVGIFRRDANGVWQRVGSIENPTGDGSFGDAQLTRDFAFVSFSRESTSGTYIYRRTKLGFRLLRSISGAFSIDEATGHLFDTAAAVDGSTIARLFKLDGRGRLHRIDRFVIPADLTTDPLRRAAIWDDVYVLTKPSDNDSQGAAYVFEKRHGHWRLRQKLIAADGQAGDLFGASVAVHGETIVIAAANADAEPNVCDAAGTASGSVYVFKRRQGIWSEDQKIKSVGEDPRCASSFGDRIFFSGRVLLILDNRSDSVSVVNGWHVFERQFGQYQPVAYQLQTIDRARFLPYDMQGATLFQGFPTRGCCDETGGVTIWDLTP
jgi:hypothetical protein